MDFDTLAIQASNILETVEHYQWSLGELSQQVVDQYGYKALVEFSKEIEKVGGVKRTPSTLRMYAYIYKKSNDLKLPKDIMFSACQSIVFSKDPIKYAKMAHDGLSGTDIRKQIYEDKN